MINIEAVRTALLAPDPYEEMDQLVLTELAAGRKTSDIVDDFRPLIQSTLGIPTLTEDGKEAFLSTLDALTGNCRSDQCYQDPPNTSLPTEEEIAVLPRWAQVAFAARCARRVFPLIRHFLPYTPQHHLQTLDQAIYIAEATAEFTGNTGHIIDSAFRAISDYYHSASLANDSMVRAVAAADAAANAFVARASNTAVSYASITLMRAAYAIGSQGNLLLRRDFDHLASLTKWSHWTDDTPVPPEVFGPLWPEGPPKGWPPITDVPRHDKLSLTFFARGRAMGQIIEDDVVNLFNALNNYHIARGGVPLTYEDLRSLLPALVPTEV